ncbi:MAG: hypothetical protein R3C44_06695 [Chloroflexota bacterium]
MSVRGLAADQRAAAVSFSRGAMLIVASYVAAQMLADIGSLKIGVVLGLAVDMGTFIYPATFTFAGYGPQGTGQAQRSNPDYCFSGNQSDHGRLSGVGRQCAQ